jgi:prepilin-type N-terminal cleavage/methylation domain-containing protein
MSLFEKKCLISEGKQGFTLIELLIIIAIIAILTTVVFVALNPLARFQDARNSRRWTDVNAILSAIKLNQVDNGGAYFTELISKEDSVRYQIGSGSNCNDCSLASSECLEIDDLIDKGYLPSMPVDPNADGASTEATKYYVVRNPNGSIEVGACFSEIGSSPTKKAPTIKATR